MKRAVTGFLLVTVAGLAALTWIRYSQAEERAIRGMSANERSALYRSELEAFRSLCGQETSEGALQDQCRRRAEFILKFPECGAECRPLAISFLPEPMR